MARKRGLGKGLDALIPRPDASSSSAGEALVIPIHAVKKNPHQPRSRMDRAGLRELAESIRTHGIIQPLIVKPEGNAFQLIAGERRLEAARMAGLEEVPVVLRHADEGATLVLALIENLQRKDLNPLEAASGYRKLAHDFGLSHDEIARQVGKSRSAITNSLRLLRLSAAVRQALISEQIREGHARALAALPSAQLQSRALRLVADRTLSVRKTEALVRELLSKNDQPKPQSKRSPEESALESQLEEVLGTRVQLRRGRRGGTLSIRFFSDEELNSIVDRLLGT
jgi:ParB family chromosome partitioning protein